MGAPAPRIAPKLARPALIHGKRRPRTRRDVRNRFALFTNWLLLDNAPRRNQSLRDLPRPATSQPDVRRNKPGSQADNRVRVPRARRSHPCPFRTDLTAMHRTYVAILSYRLSQPQLAVVQGASRPWLRRMRPRFDVWGLVLLGAPESPGAPRDTALRGPGFCFVGSPRGAGTPQQRQPVLSRSCPGSPAPSGPRNEPPNIETSLTQIPTRRFP